MRPADQIFGELAKEYSLHRPEYPQGIIDAILTVRGGVYVDIACGSGQLTRKLSPFFQKTIATDKSHGQIEIAGDEDIEYLVQDATDRVPTDSGSVTLVTVAQALHWFWESRDDLWREVDRILKPGGVLAIASYGVLEFQDPQLQAIFDHFYLGVLGSDLPPGTPGCAWQCDRRLVDCGYAGEVFPYAQTRTLVREPKLTTLGALLAYLRTYSCLETLKPLDPLEDLKQALIREGGLTSVDSEIQVVFPFRVITCVK